MSDNKDLGPHQSDNPKAPVLNSGFDNPDKLPILWGPNQLGTGSGYAPPDPTAWRGKEPLNIPQVCRFIYAAQSSYDSSKYPKPGPVEAPYYEIVEIISHRAPFPYDFVIRVRDSSTGIVSFYTTADYVRDYSTYPPPAVYVGGNFHVGMKYRTPWFAGAALDYRLDHYLGPGFYTRSGGALPVTPF